MAHNHEMIDEIDFEFESDGGFDVEEDDDIVEIENLYYEAEDSLNQFPDVAIEKFLKVVSLGETIHQQNNSTARTSDWIFKALYHTVIICGKQGRYDDVLKHYQHLLTLLPSVTRNEAAIAIDSILDAISIHNTEKGIYSIDTVQQSSETLTQLQQIYTLTLNTLQAGNHQTLWFTTTIKLSKLYIEQGDIANLQLMVDKLYAAAKLNRYENPMEDDTEQHSTTHKNSQIFEIYALHTQLCLLTKNTDLMRTVYRKTLQLAATVTDPRTVATVRFSGGMMYMEDRKWDTAYHELFEAFKNYQEAGCSTQAKHTLKFVALANLLSSSKINPFDSREASVYQDDPDITAMHQLRLAFDSHDSDRIATLFTNPANPLLKDPEMNRFSTDLLQTIRLQLVQRAIEPYATVNLIKLATDLRIPQEELQALIIKLICDKVIHAEIDDTNNVLIRHPSSLFRDSGSTSSSETKPGSESYSYDSAGAVSKMFQQHEKLSIALRSISVAIGAMSRDKLRLTGDEII